MYTGKNNDNIKILIQIILLMHIYSFNSSDMGVGKPRYVGPPRNGNNLRGMCMTINGFEVWKHANGGAVRFY